MGAQVQHISGSAGGVLVGRSHANGGIKAINKATGQPLEMEGGEVVITKPAVASRKLVEFQGKMMTNREVLSAINVSGGGVAFAEKGCELPQEIYVSGSTYEFGGETLTDNIIVQKISNCGCRHTFKSGGSTSSMKTHKLYHGTRHGAEFDIFSNDYENSGAGSNAFAQGKVTYLTDSLSAARYFSRKANASYFLKQGNKPDSDAQSVADSAWEATFGSGAPALENVKEVILKPKAKIKQLDYYPSREQAAVFMAEGKYDGLRFPEKGFSAIEDMPSDLNNSDVYDSQTTIIFNPETIMEIKQVAPNTNPTSKKILNARQALVKDEDETIRWLLENDPEFAKQYFSNLERTPTDIFEQFRETLREGVLNHFSASEINKIQYDWFQNHVIRAPRLIGKYIECIQVLPKKNRDYFFHLWLEDSDFMEKLNDNPFNLLPAELKPLIKVKQLPVSLSPENSNLDDITSAFTVRDELRPKLAGVFFSKEHKFVAATDAHKMIFLSGQPSVDNSSICLLGKNKQWYERTQSAELSKNNDGCWELKEQYPQVLSVIPTEFKYIFTVDANTLLQYADAAEYFSPKVTQMMFLAFKDEDRTYYRAFNHKILQTCLNAMLQLGNDEIDICMMEATNRPILLVPKGNARKITSYGIIETDLTLCMPVMAIESVNFSPVYDLQNQKATTMAHMNRVFGGERPARDISLMNIVDYPELVELLRSMSEEEIRDSLFGYCEPKLPDSKTQICTYGLFVSDTRYNPPVSYPVALLPKAYYISTENSEADAVNEVLYAIGKKDRPDLDDLDSSISGLKLLLDSETEIDEIQEIQGAISGLELLRNISPIPQAYEFGGIIGQQYTAIDLPLDAKPENKIKLVKS